MRNNWKKHQLFDLYDVRSGMGNKSRKDFHPTKYENKMIMFKDVFYNSKLPNKLETTVNLIGTELERFNVLKDDVFLTSSSETSNELAMSSVAMKDYNNTVFTGFTKRLRPKTDLTYIGFMRYWFRSFEFRRVIDSSVSMTTRANLNNSILSNVTITLPSINEQKAIANILSSFDDKIEVNNKINENLENLAQVLYKHWFVDFEFPNEEGKPYKSSGGKIIDSEIGSIPEGWIIRDIEDVSNVLLGGTPSRKRLDYWNGDIKWINSGEVNNTRIIKETETITKLGFDNSSTKLLPKKTIVLAITGATLGAISLTEIETCANQSVIGIVENGILPYTYIFSYMKENINSLINRQTGGAQQHINRNDVSTFPIVQPSGYIIKLFDSITNLYHEKISKNLFENEKLAEIRDLLLPKLMSGEIRVPIKE